MSICSFVFESIKVTFAAKRLVPLPTNILSPGSKSLINVVLLPVISVESAASVTVPVVAVKPALEAPTSAI